MIDTSGLTDEEKKAFEEGYAILNQQYKVAIDSMDMDILKSNLANMEQLLDYENFRIRHDFHIDNGSQNFHIMYIYTQGHAEEHHALAYADSIADIGHVVIRPETIEDKILEIFQHKEVDFKRHREFSHRYYVLAEDKEKVRKCFSTEILDLMNSVNSLHLEMRDRKVIAGMHSVMKGQHIQILAAFMVKFLQLLKGDKKPEKAKKKV